MLGLDLRFRRVGLVVFVVGVGMMASSLLESPLHHLRTTFEGHPAVGAAGAALGIAGLVAAAAVFQRWPWLYLLAVVAAAPARVPVHVGDTDAHLLVPLYAVIAAGAAATAYELVRDRDPGRRTGWIGIARRDLVAWTAISLSWSADRHQGAIEVMFFYAALRRCWSPGWRSRAPIGRACRRLLTRPGGARGRVRRGRRYQELHPRRLLEPQVDGRERLQLVLPRQLALLGPSIFGALHGGDDRARVRGADLPPVHAAAGALIARAVRSACTSPTPSPACWRWPRAALALGATSWPRRVTHRLGAPPGRRSWARGLAVSLRRQLGVDSVTSERSHLVGDGLRLCPRASARRRRPRRVRPGRGRADGRRGRRAAPRAHARR